MPIEFRCMQCGKLLRTADDTAGKQAQCPHCGSVMTIPGAETGPASPFAAESLNPYQSPGDYAALPAGAPSGEIMPATLDFSDVFRRTWEIFKANWGNCVIAWLIVFVLNMVISYGLAFGLSLFGRAMVGQRGEAAFGVLANVLANLISIWLGIGLMIYMLKIARGQAAEFSDLFGGSRNYLAILLASIAYGLMTTVGFILCIVPGVIVALMFSQYYFTTS